MNFSIDNSNTIVLLFYYRAGGMKSYGSETNYTEAG